MKITSYIISNLCSVKKVARPSKIALINMTSTSYLIPRQRQISKTKWYSLYTFEKQNQRNPLSVTSVLCL